MTQYVAIDLNHCPRLHIRCIATRENKNELQLPIQIGKWMNTNCRRRWPKTQTIFVEICRRAMIKPQHWKENYSAKAVNIELINAFQWLHWIHIDTNDHKCWSDSIMIGWFEQKWQMVGLCQPIIIINNNNNNEKKKNDEHNRTGETTILRMQFKARSVMFSMLKCIRGCVRVTNKFN